MRLITRGGLASSNYPTPQVDDQINSGLESSVDVDQKCPKQLIYKNTHIKETMAKNFSARNQLPSAGDKERL